MDDDTKENLFSNNFCCGKDMKKIDSGYSSGMIVRKCESCGRTAWEEIDD
jgi:hypothetical protein